MIFKEVELQRLINLIESNGTKVVILRVGSIHTPGSKNAVPLGSMEYVVLPTS